MSRLGLIIPTFLSVGLLIHAQSYTVSTFAGTDTLRDGAPATSTLLQRPTDAVMDAAGNLYIADADANRIRRVSPAGIVTTFAGTGRPGFDGDGGDATQALLDGPTCAVTDKTYLYICDRNNARVRRVRLSTGVITTVAGNGSPVYSGDGGPAVNAGMDPISVTLDAAGNIYVADFINNRVRKVAIADGKITAFAGLGIAGFAGDNQQATGAALYGPADVAVDANGNVYIADYLNFVIRKVDAKGVISTFAGDGYPDTWGDGGPASQASFWLIDSIALDVKNNQLLVLSDDCVRAINLGSTIVTRVAGTTDLGFKGDGGPATNAQFAWSYGFSVTADGDIYVADTGNYRVRKISGGVISTVAGTDVKDGVAATSAMLSLPLAVALTPTGELVIADSANQRVRKVAVNGTISTIAGTGVRGSTAGRIYQPGGLAYDSQGTLFIADTGNNRILRVTPAGNATVFAGGKAGSSGDGGTGGAALFTGPAGLAFDAAGNMYIADEGNLKVRKIDAATGVISTVAGSGRPGSSGVNGPATQMQMDPISVAVDAGGNLYIADYTNNRVLKVTASSGIASIVAGTGAAGFSGDGGPAVRAQVSHPTAVAVDVAGTLYICDYGNAALRRVTPGGTIDTIAGSGAFLFDRDSGPALGTAVASFNLALGPAGAIYVADAINNRIRKLTPQVASAISISGGNNLKGDPNAKLQISVKVVDAAGTPVGGVVVSFTVASGSATLSSAAATTIGHGTATVTVTLGQTAGPVVIRANAAGLTQVTFNLTVNQVNTTPVPAIGSVASAGLSTPVLRSVAAGGIASVFGQNFAPAGTAARVGGGDLADGKVPTVFSGVCVLVGGVRAPIFAVYANQVNFQVPAVAAGSAGVQVVTGCGTAAELKSNTDSLTIRASAPEFFYFKANADGRNPIAAQDAVTGAVMVSADLFPDSGFRPARPSTYVSLYGTSFGAVNPGVAPGEIPPSLAQVAGAVTLMFGGREIPAVDILYTGVAPGNPGLYQLNFRIPADMPDGDHAVVLTIGGVSSPAGPYLTVKAN